uniref:NAC transcription factor 53 n=1 Tax=Litchi chinensis TaxID=151069 RepID=A0A8K1HZE3_LITCN|nr:NAC transcription factor 53 [Litchi chinensis]
MEDQQQEDKPRSKELDAGLYASSSLVSGNVNGGDDDQLEVCGEVGFKYPPGYRFDPYDHELVVFYLKPKVLDMYVPPNVIHEVELYRFSPDQLAASFKPHDGKIWYFFTPRDRRYKNGERPNRTAEGGYWKATGADKAVMFHDAKLDNWVLCRIYRKADKPNRGRSRSTRARGDSEDEVEAEHEDTHAHNISAESNVVVEETDIPPSSGDINGFSNLQATGMPPFYPYDSATCRIPDDMRYSESPQSKCRDNEMWAEDDNSGHFLAPLANVIPPYCYGNCSHQATRMQYFNTYDNVASWQNVHGRKYSQNRQSQSVVPQSRFHPYMQNSTPMQHMAPVDPNTRYQNAAFEKYAYQNSVYQYAFAAKAMPGSSTSASQSSENHVKVEPSSSQPARQSAVSQMNNEHFTSWSSDESCLHERYFNSGDY